jgi:hypothetical protein
MSRLLVCTLLSLLLTGLATGSSLRCVGGPVRTHSGLSFDCSPAVAANENDLYAMVPSPDPNPIFSGLEAGSASTGDNPHSWLLVILSVFGVVVGSIIRILMSDRVETFLEELFEPMNWTSANHG